jgi:hypothetical protein
MGREEGGKTGEKGSRSTGPGLFSRRVWRGRRGEQHIENERMNRTDMLRRVV